MQAALVSMGCSLDKLNAGCIEPQAVHKSFKCLIEELAQLQRTYVVLNHKIAFYEDGSYWISGLGVVPILGACLSAERFVEWPGSYFQWNVLQVCDAIVSYVDDSLESGNQGRIRGLSELERYIQSCSKLLCHEPWVQGAESKWLQMLLCA